MFIFLCGAAALAAAGLVIGLLIGWLFDKWM